MERSVIADLDERRGGEACGTLEAYREAVRMPRRTHERQNAAALTRYMTFT